MERHGNSSFVDFNDVLNTGQNASNVPSNLHQPCSDLIDCCGSEASITCAERGHWYHQMDMEVQIIFSLLQTVGPPSLCGGTGWELKSWITVPKVMYMDQKQIMVLV